MHDNHRIIWDNFVRQAQYHLEGEDPMVEDTMIVRVDVYIKNLEKRVAELTHAEEIRIARSMSRDASEALVKAGIHNEITTKGNV